MIFDAYTARLRAQLPADAADQPDRLLEIHDETKAVVDRACADVELLSRLQPSARALADAAVRAGVRVSIEHHPRPEAR